MKPFVLTTIKNMRNHNEYLGKIRRYHEIVAQHSAWAKPAELERYEMARDAAKNAIATDRLADELATVNGRASRHVYSAGEILSNVEGIERQLERDGITVKNRAGITVTMRSGVPTSNAYSKKGRTCVATIVELERNGSSWRVVGVARTEQWAGSGGEEQITIRLPDAAKADVIRHALRNYDCQLVVAAEAA